MARLLSVVSASLVVTNLSRLWSLALLMVVAKGERLFRTCTASAEVTEKRLPELPMSPSPMALPK